VFRSGHHPPDVCRINEPLPLTLSPRAGRGKRPAMHGGGASNRADERDCCPSRMRLHLGGRASSRALIFPDCLRSLRLQGRPPSRDH